MTPLSATLPTGAAPSGLILPFAAQERPARLRAVPGDVA